MKSSELSIIVYSCKKNSDMWGIFSKLFNKYWNDCQYSIYMLTDKMPDVIDEELCFDDYIVCDDTWGRMIKRACKEIKTPYVSLWMDDYLLCDSVKNNDIENCISIMDKMNPSCLRLSGLPKWQNKTNPFEEGILEIHSGEAYCLTLQVNIWNNKFLNQFIEEEWSAWDFERIGSMKKSEVFKTMPILALSNYIFPYEEGVRRGKWMVQGANLCIRNGIDLNVQRRPIMSNKDMAWIYFKGAILDLNANFIVKIQNILRRR